MTPSRFSLWNGIINFIQYAIRHPVKTGIGLLILGVSIPRQLWSFTTNNFTDDILNESITLSTPNPVYSTSFDFKEYQVSTKLSANPDKFFNMNDLPDIQILPSIQLRPQDSLPKSTIFTKKYLEDHEAVLEKRNYYARGDDRSPKELGNSIPPPNARFILIESCGNMIFICIVK